MHNNNAFVDPDVHEGVEEHLVQDSLAHLVLMQLDRLPQQQDRTEEATREPEEEQSSVAENTQESEARQFTTLQTAGRPEGSPPAPSSAATTRRGGDGGGGVEGTASQLDAILAKRRARAEGGPEVSTLAGTGEQGSSPQAGAPVPTAAQTGRPALSAGTVGSPPAPSSAATTRRGGDGGGGVEGAASQLDAILAKRRARAEGGPEVSTLAGTGEQGSSPQAGAPVPTALQTGRPVLAAGPAPPAPSSAATIRPGGAGPGGGWEEMGTASQLDAILAKRRARAEGVPEATAGTPPDDVQSRGAGPLGGQEGSADMAHAPTEGIIGRSGTRAGRWQGTTDLVPTAALPAAEPALPTIAASLATSCRDAAQVDGAAASTELPDMQADAEAVSEGAVPETHREAEAACSAQDAGDQTTGATCTSAQTAPAAEQARLVFTSDSCEAESMPLASEVPPGPSNDTTMLSKAKTTSASMLRPAAEVPENGDERVVATTQLGYCAVQPTECGQEREKLRNSIKKIHGHISLYGSMEGKPPFVTATTKNLVVLGLTGSGKSTLINSLAGCEMRRPSQQECKERGIPIGSLVVRERKDGGPRDAVSKIGHKQSETQGLIPLYLEEKNLVVWDCPGFHDTGGAEVEIANAVNLCHLLDSSRDSGLVIMATFQEGAFDVSRGEPFKKTMKVIGELFNNPEAIQSAIRSTIFCVTKAVQELSYFQEKTVELCEETSVVVSEADKERVVIYDALNKHENRISREQLLQLVQEVAPIRPTGQAFRSTLQAEGEQLLKRIATAVAADIRSNMEGSNFEGVKNDYMMFQSLRVISHPEIEKQICMIQNAIKEQVETWKNEIHKAQLCFDPDRRLHVRQYLEILERAKEVDEACGTVGFISSSFEEMERVVKKCEEDQQLQESKNLEQEFERILLHCRDGLKPNGAEEAEALAMIFGEEPLAADAWEKPLKEVMRCERPGQTEPVFELLQLMDEKEQELAQRFIFPNVKGLQSLQHHCREMVGQVVRHLSAEVTAVKAEGVIRESWRNLKASLSQREFRKALTMVKKGSDVRKQLNIDAPELGLQWRRLSLSLSILGRDSEKEVRSLEAEQDSLLKELQARVEEVVGHRCVKARGAAADALRRLEEQQHSVIAMHLNGSLPLLETWVHQLLQMLQGKQSHLGAQQQRPGASCGVISDRHRELLRFAFNQQVVDELVENTNFLIVYEPSRCLEILEHLEQFLFFFLQTVREEKSAKAKEATKQLVLRLQDKFNRHMGKADTISTDFPFDEVQVLVEELKTDLDSLKHHDGAGGETYTKAVGRLQAWVNKGSQLTFQDENKRAFERAMLNYWNLQVLQETLAQNHPLTLSLPRLEMERQLHLLRDRAIEEMQAEEIMSFGQFREAVKTFEGFTKIMHSVLPEFVDLSHKALTGLQQACDMWYSKKIEHVCELVRSSKDTGGTGTVARCLVKGYGLFVELGLDSSWANHVQEMLLEKLSDSEKFLVGSELKAFTEKDGGGEISEMARAVIDKFPEFQLFAISLFNEKAGAITFEKALKDIAGNRCSPPRPSNSNLKVAHESFFREYSRLVNAMMSNMFDEDAMFNDIKGLTSDLDASNLSANCEGVGELLAKICGVWSNLCRGNTDASFIESRYIRQPHATQILAILRILSVDYTEMQNHLIQIGTGEGKSVALGITAALLATLGVHVDVVCYSAYLSSRDAAQFAELFRTLRVDDRVRYSTFWDRDRSSAHTVDVEGAFRCLLRQEAWNGTPDAGKTHVLLLDEVDVFFSEAFFGKTENLASYIQNEHTFSLLSEVWKRRSTIDCNQPGLATVTAEFEQLPATVKLLQEYPGLTSFLPRELKRMFEGVQYFAGPGEPELPRRLRDYIFDSDTNRILYVDPLSGVPMPYMFSYITIFTYFYCWQVKGKMSEQQVKQQAYLVPMCGYLLNSSIPRTYKYCIGMSGTLSCLSDTQWKLLHNCSLGNCYTVLGSTFQKKQLNCDWDGKPVDSEHTDTQVVPGDSFDEYFQVVLNEVRYTLQNGRALLIVVKDEEKLRTFAKAFQRVNKILHCKYEQPFELSDSLPVSDRESVVIRAMRKYAITIMTRSYGRGTDFVCRDRALTQCGGVHVLVTFFPMDKSEDAQIKGRTCRQDDPGSYKKLLLEADLSSFGASENDKNNKDIESWDQYLSDLRDAQERQRFASMMREEEALVVVHNRTMKGKLSEAATHFRAISRS